MLTNLWGLFDPGEEEAVENKNPPSTLAPDLGGKDEEDPYRNLYWSRVVSLKGFRLSGAGEVANECRPGRHAGGLRKYRLGNHPAIDPCL